MIDKNTGNVIISNLIHIKHNDLKQYISLLHIGETSAQHDHGNGWSWIQENNVFADGNYFIIRFGFFESKLKQLFLSVSDTKFEFDNTDWSEEKELKKLEIYKNWLAQELGSQREFAWGTASALFDSKSLSSSIHIVYK
jgi:hypothetical protein